MSVLKPLQALFYAAFAFLWFKDNFPNLRSFKASPAIPLAGLGLVLAARLGLKIRSGWRPKIKAPKGWKALLLILLVIFASRVPFLLLSHGLMDSDEAIPALEAKHIAEGRIPPIYYYGALFQGTFPQHYYALLFKLFGYSVVLAKLAALLAYLGFVAIQFFLLQEIFSTGFAAAAGLFYALPLEHLVLTSFDVGSAFPVVLLLGAAIFGLTYLLAFKKRETLVAPLGFLMGLAFWSHQIAAIFLAAAAVFLIARFRFRIVPYLRAGISFVLGVLPVLMSEILYKPVLVQMLFGGQTTGLVGAGKLARARRFLLALVTSAPRSLGLLLLALLAAGFAVLAARSIRGRRLRPEAIFPVYAAVFGLVYLLSDFSNADIIRYLYVFYLAVPVLLLAPVLLVRGRRRFAAAGAGLLILLGLANTRGIPAYYRSVADHDRDLREVLTVMGASGERYWKAHYWTSYLLTAASRERLIVASDTLERYPYYQLLHDTENPHTNLVFLRDTPRERDWAKGVVDMLDRTKTAYRSAKVRDWQLVWGIESRITPKVLLFPPQEIPEAVLRAVAPGESGIDFRFDVVSSVPTGGFRMNVEVPGFASASTPLPAGERSFSVRLPYPPGDAFAVKTFIDYHGMTIEPTVRRLDYRLPAGLPPPRPPDLEVLEGERPRERMTGRELVSIDRLFRFRVNKPPSGIEAVRIRLFLPFLFEDFWWHGEFVQEAEILVNGTEVRRQVLPDGPGEVLIEIATPPFRESGGNVIELRFKYGLVISIEDHWRTAALLETIEILPKEDGD